MPITIPDNLGLGAGQNYPVIDITDQSIKGLSFFATLQDAIDTAKAYQKIPGFIAVITDGTPSIYQFIGSDNSVWNNTEFWTQLGAPETTPQAASYLDVMSLNVVPFGKHDAAVSTNYNLDITKIPLEFELVPLTDSTASIYDVYTLNPTIPNYTTSNNTWSNTWLNQNGAFSSYNDDTALSSISFLGSAKLGYEHLIPRFAGFSASDVALIQGVNWTGANTTITDYLLTIPEALRPKVYHLHMPSDQAIQDEIYIGYDPTNGFGDAQWITASNWTYLTEPNTTTISYRILISSTTNNVSEATTFAITASYPFIASQLWVNHIGINNYVADMLKKIQVIMKFNPATIAHLESLKASANSPFGDSEDDLTFTLKTLVIP